MKLPPVRLVRRYDTTRLVPFRRDETVLAKLATDGMRVFAIHFPFPGVGHVVAQGEGQAWKPEAR